MFGAISAIYSGLYLILPGCLCPLLNCFGVTHVDSSTQTEERCVMTDGSNQALCHCHDAASKTAEPTQTSENGSGTFSAPIVLFEDAVQIPSQRISIASVVR